MILDDGPASGAWMFQVLGIVGHFGLAADAAWRSLGENGFLKFV